MINSDISNISQISDSIQETERNEATGSIDPYLRFADSAPIDVLQSLRPLFTEKTFDQASKKCIDLLLYHSTKNNKDVPLSTLIGSIWDQKVSNERRIFNLILIKAIINYTPVEEELDIPVDFINILMGYFPHSLCINVCSDLIKKDIVYCQHFSQCILNLDENTSQDPSLAFNNFFLRLMKNSLYDSLVLLQSFLLCKENLIYMEPIFEEVLTIISSCEIMEKIECFNVLSTFFESDDLYYSKLISNQKRLSLIFTNLERNSLLIESSLNFANEVTYSNVNETMEFIKISKLYQMIIDVLPFVNDQKIVFLWCKICERMIYYNSEKGVSFLLKKNIIFLMNSIKTQFCISSFQDYMHLVSKCILKASKSQVISILSIIPLTDFGNYAQSLDKEEASPLMMKIASVILNEYETTGDYYEINEATYNEFCTMAMQESDDDNIITEFLRFISPLLKRNGLIS